MEHCTMVHRLGELPVLASEHVDIAQRLHPLLLMPASAKHDTYRNAVGSACDNWAGENITGSNAAGWMM